MLKSDKTRLEFLEGGELARGLEQWFLVPGARELKTTEKLAET